MHHPLTNHGNVNTHSLKVMDAAMKHEKRLVRVHGAVSKVREWCPNSCSVVRMHGVLSDSPSSRSVVQEFATRPLTVACSWLVKSHPGGLDLFLRSADFVPFCRATQRL